MLHCYMNKLLLISVCIGILLVAGTTYAYICIYPQSDNQYVQDFKTRLNILSIYYDLENGYDEQAVLTKLKYFSPCN
jgi:hypothetical protein